MRRPPALCWLPLAAMAFAAAAFAQTDPPLTYRAIREMPPSAAGLRLLGPERGTDIVRIHFLDLSPEARRLPIALQLFLYARPVPFGLTYCSQRLHLVVLSRAASDALRPLGAHTPLRILHSDERSSLARAPGCRLAADQRFAQTAEPELAMRALDDLASAQTAALSATGTMPFQLTCRDEIEDDPDRCGAGARDALAHLPLDQACWVAGPSDGRPNVEVTLCTGGPLWVLHLPAPGSDPPRLSMLWKYPEGTY